MKRLFLVLALFVMSGSFAYAQLTSSALVGTVAGPDGLVPGATVVVRDNKTGNEVTTVTNKEGSYRVPNLEVGTYTVTITAPGFKTFSAQEVKIDISKDYSLAARLDVGGVEETVTVTAGAEIINSVDGEVNSTVSRRQLDDLPSLGRNPLNFVTLQPGVANNANQQPVINGIRTSATNITIDGVNVQDNYIRSNATAFSPARPTVDEVEEFAVSTQNSADDGFGGAQIQFSTRRGGNDFHFRLFEFNRNSDFAANNFFINAAGGERPFRNRNQFGGNVSGPLPFFNFGEGGPIFRSGKDRLFFFFAYEKLIDRQPAPPQNSTVLTSSARQGIFTYRDNSGQIRQVNLFNPAFNTGITGINPVIGSRFLSNIPQGNTTQVGDQLNTTGFQVIQNFNQTQTNYTTRIDYQVNPLNNLTGTFRYVKQDLNRADIDNSFNTDPRVTQPSANPFLSLGLTSVISSDFTNELRGGFFFSDPSFLRRDPLPSSFFTLPLVTNPEVSFEDQGRKVKTYNVQDNASYTFGSHRLRFGGQYQKVEIDAFAGFTTVPTFTIGTGTATPSITTAQFTNSTLFPGGVPVAQRGGANSLLALLGGIVSAGSQTLNVTSRDSGFVPGATERRLYSYDIFGFHLSDQWRATRDLTLNFGVRYDRYSPLKSLDGIFLEPVISNPDDLASAVLDPNGRYQFVGGNAGKEGLFYKADNNNFAPVLSFAYAPKFDKGIGAFLFGANTVLRGGYRISYINDELVRAPDNALSGNQGLSLTARAFRPGTTSTALNARIDNIPGIPVPPFTGDNRTFAQNNALAGNFGTVFAIDPNIQTPLVQEYSFGIQREIGFDTALEVRYVGTRSNNLLRGIDFNQVNIRDNGFLTDFNRARGNLLACQSFFGGMNQSCPTGADFNSSVPGSQQLTVFPNLAAGGLLTNGTITGLIQSGQVAQLAFVYLSNNLQGGVNFVPNPNAGVADVLSNGGEYNYNALQIDLRRRFTKGFALNANYTFSKNLTNAVGTGQTRFEPFLDINQPELERSRADFDQSHKFNLLASYELPFGKGKRFFNEGVLATIFGNFQIGSILQIGSGSPITFIDPNGTLNRSGRSGRQTAVTNLTAGELQSLVGIYRTPNGIFFLPPEVLGRNADGTVNTSIGGTGRGSNGLGTSFAGQTFFNNTPGTTSSLGRAIVDGPAFYNLDVSLIKRFVIGERLTFQLQADLFNALNNVNFNPGQFLNINSDNFGRITTASDARVVQLAFRINF